MFAKLRALERRIKVALNKLKNDQSKLSNMRIKWQNLPDKTKLNDNFSEFVKNQAKNLHILFDKIYKLGRNRQLQDPRQLLPAEPNRQFENREFGRARAGFEHEKENRGTGGPDGKPAQPPQSGPLSALLLVIPIGEKVLLGVRQVHEAVLTERAEQLPLAVLDGVLDLELGRTRGALHSEHVHHFFFDDELHFQLVVVERVQRVQVRHDAAEVLFGVGYVGGDVVEVDVQHREKGDRVELLRDFLLDQRVRVRVLDGHFEAVAEGVLRLLVHLEQDGRRVHRARVRWLDLLGQAPEEAVVDSLQAFEQFAVGAVEVVRGRVAELEQKVHFLEVVELGRDAEEVLEEGQVQAELQHPPRERPQNLHEVLREQLVRHVVFEIGALAVSEKGEAHELDRQRQSREDDAEPPHARLIFAEILRIVHEDVFELAQRQQVPNRRGQPVAVDGVARDDIGRGFRARLAPLVAGGPLRADQFQAELLEEILVDLEGRIAREGAEEAAEEEVSHGAVERGPGRGRLGLGRQVQVRRIGLLARDIRLEVAEEEVEEDPEQVVLDQERREEVRADHQVQYEVAPLLQQNVVAQREHAGEEFEHKVCREQIVGLLGRDVHQNELDDQGQVGMRQVLQHERAEALVRAHDSDRDFAFDREIREENQNGPVDVVRAVLGNEEEQVQNVEQVDVFVAVHEPREAAQRRDQDWRLDGAYPVACSPI